MVRTSLTIKVHSGVVNITLTNQRLFNNSLIKYWCGTAGKRLYKHASKLKLVYLTSSSPLLNRLGMNTYCSVMHSNLITHITVLN